MYTLMENSLKLSIIFFKTNKKTKTKITKNNQIIK